MSKHTMLERERVMLALQRIEPDRVPCDFRAVPEVERKLMAYFNVSTMGEVLDRLAVDVREVAPTYIGPKAERLPDGTVLTPNGLHIRLVSNAYSEYWETASFTLGHCETADDVRAFPRWPSADRYDWDGFTVKSSTLHKRYATKLQLGGLFEFAWQMRGMERFMMDMYDNPEVPHAIMRIITDYNIDMAQRALNAAGDKIDIVYTFDDIAGQRGLMMAPAMWEEFIAPYHMELCAVIHRYGKQVMYHSCGAVYSMIPRLMTLPIDILDPLQPKANNMDFAKMKAEFGDSLSFHGGIDIQELLPRGTVDEVQATVRETVNILGKGGGFILCSAHNIQADTPVANVLAAYDVDLRYLATK